MDDLLQGHVNPEIRQFVNQYLRPMQERTEDIKDETEGRKLSRMGLQDQAANSRLDAQIYRHESQIEVRPVQFAQNYLAIGDSLISAKKSIAHSLYETNILQGLHFRSQNLKQATRFFNHFLTAVMEGRVAPGQEEFADFLIEQIQNFSGISEKRKQILKLYIQARYGDPKTPRVIPFSLAQEHGLFRNEVALLTESADKRTKEERQEFQERYIKNEWDHYNRIYDDKYWWAKREKIDVSSLPHRKMASGWDKSSLMISRKIIKSPATVYSHFVWLLAYPELWGIVSPYKTAHFVMGIYEIDKLIFRVCWSFDPGFKSLIYDDRGKNACHCCNPDLNSCYYGGTAKANCIAYVRFIFEHTEQYQCYVKDNVVNKLKKFLRKYREGAFVILALIETAQSGWRGGVDEPLPLPEIEGKDPIEVLHVVKKLNDFMRSNLNYDVLLNYFDKGKGLSTFKKGECHLYRRGYVTWSTEEFLEILSKEDFTLKANRLELAAEAEMLVSCQPSIAG